MQRRDFLNYCRSAGLATTLFPGVLWAQIQPGTKKITLEMVRESARLAGLEWTDQDCQDVTDSLSSLARGAEGINKSTLTNASPLPIHFNPNPPGVAPPKAPAPVFRIEAAPQVKRPANLEDAAFWPVTHLAQLLRTKQVTSQELTTMYLARLKRHNGVLNCVAALTEERAMAEAAEADRQLRAGRDLGPLHGIPYGVKDIIAAKGAPTSWGAAPLASQVFDEDATVVARLHAAGAVLVAKLTTGEFAFGDQWSGGRTNNPWNPAEGSSGSSAGPGAATAAGLVGFSIGSDTGGSILSPSVRCGLVGLRPTFGRVSRHGVMAAGTTLDKIGPMCRHAQDCAIVLRATAGPDDQDLAVVRDLPVTWDPAAGRYPKRIGFVPAMLEAERDPEQRANNQRALDMLKRLGCTTHEITPAARRSQLLHRVHRARRRVRLVHDVRLAQRREPAHQPVPARLPARHRRGLPAGEPAPGRDHAGGRPRDARRGRGDVHDADAQLRDEPQSGDEPHRPSVDRGAERLSRERHADGRDVLRSSLSRRGDHRVGEGVAGPIGESWSSAARIRGLRSSVTQLVPVYR